MGTRSFFVEQRSIQGGRADLRGPTAHQIRNVLRLQPGDAVDLLDGSGYVHMAHIVESSREGVVCEVVERYRSAAEPWVNLELYQGLLKGQKMELVLQKGTEIGVSRFVPVLSERCISRPAAADLAHRAERWQSILREAAEQSGRAMLPTVAPPETFEGACRAMARADLALMAWEEERSTGIREILCASGLAGASGEEREQPPRIALLVGPEGGFSGKEAQTARAAGIHIAGMGSRILRAETAALVAATVVLCELGDLGG